MLTKNHNMLTAEVEAHIAADAVVQGSYWNGSHGCFIACLTHSSKSSDAEKLQELFGLPLPLVKICENIFEALPENDAKAFFAAFPGAVACDGKDLSRVHWEFMAAELRALPPQSTDTQAIIDLVIRGMDLLAAEKAWPHATAVDARVAAITSGRTAAYAAAHVAVLAATVADPIDAARAAAAVAGASARARHSSAAAVDTRRRQRDTILQLITEAPTQRG